MAGWIAYDVLVGLIAYLLGSIPTGYWLGKVLYGVDIREHGSKSTGATNVLRTFGKVPALMVLLVDLLKGVAAVTFARWFLSLAVVRSTQPVIVNSSDWLPWAIVVVALLAIVGHSRSVFIRFSGGKSAATGLGVLFAVCWQAGIGAAICFIGVLAVSRIVSLSSMSAATAAVALMVVFRQPTAFLLMTIAGAVYVVWRHKANIRRIIVGIEPRIGQVG